MSSCTCRWRAANLDSHGLWVFSACTTKVILSFLRSSLRTQNIHICFWAFGSGTVLTFSNKLGLSQLVFEPRPRTCMINVLPTFSSQQKMNHYIWAVDKKYCGILLAPTCRINYVKMQHNYVHMRLIIYIMMHVNIIILHVDINKSYADINKLPVYLAWLYWGGSKVCHHTEATFI